jgi:tRNA (Thr-GGU) A37 N-methylase
MREPAGQIELAAIGRVESPLTDAASAPNQGDEGAPDAWLVFEPDVLEALPNPIGLHRVKVASIEGARVLVHDLEALDATPIVDVKPVLSSDVSER